MDTMCRNSTAKMSETNVMMHSVLNRNVFQNQPTRAIFDTEILDRSVAGVPDDYIPKYMSWNPAIAKCVNTSAYSSQRWTRAINAKQAWPRPKSSFRPFRSGRGCFPL